MRPIDADALLAQWESVPQWIRYGAKNDNIADMAMSVAQHMYNGVIRSIKEAPTLDFIPVKPKRKLFSWFKRG